MEYTYTEKKRIRKNFGKRKEVKDIPIWMSLGLYDNVSSYYMAKEMADSLTLYGAEIKFKTLSIGHWGWNEIYSDSDAINWLMSWRKIL